MYENEHVELPTRKKDFVDVAIFDKKTIDDIDVSVLDSMMQVKGANLYAVLLDQIQPMILRRSGSSSMQSVIDKLRELKAKVDVLSEGSPSRNQIMNLFDNELSVEAVRSNKKSLAFQAEDYFVFDVFLETLDVNKFKHTRTMAISEDEKLKAFSDVMREYDARRFEKNAVENESKSIDIALFKAFMKRLEDNDLAGICGLGDAVNWLTRVFIKRRFSNTAWLMLWCFSDIARLKFTDFAVASVSRNDE